MKQSIILFMVVMAVVILASTRAQAAAGKGGPRAKLSRDLVVLSDEYFSYLSQGRGAVFTPHHRLLRVSQGRVVIDAVASGDVHALQADLEALGMQGAVAFGRIVSGQLPIAAIEDMAALARLHFARPAYATTNVGLVTSQGDQAMHADVARTRFGVDGKGVTVGALSDSFNCLGSAAADVASDDLSPVTVIEELPDCSVGTDEGRAMLQLVHDVAPGASLAFATASTGQAGFASNILALQAAGAGVIVDDVIYFAEPMFQDGIIAQAVDAVKGRGVPYFSAAGNRDRQSYHSLFRAGPFFADGAFPSAPDPSVPPFIGGTAHDFTPGPGVNVFQRITVPEISGFFISFQWDAPFASVCPGCPGSPNDLNIYVFNDPSTTVLAGSTDPNIGGDAVEVFGFFNPPGSGVTAFNIMITKADGPNPRLIKYVQFTDGVTIDQFDTHSSTLYGHANAAGATAVGAAFYRDTPAFGVFPPLLEPLSSSGSTPILFDTAGNRLAVPEIRLKPEIVGPDGTNTTFFGFDVEPDGFPNFFGTSAAAPHAAAVAALMLQADPTATPQKVAVVLDITAINMGPRGFDFDSGFGLIQADRALAALLLLPRY